jgi:hypothetical protein
MDQYPRRSNLVVATGAPAWRAVMLCDGQQTLAYSLINYYCDNSRAATVFSMTSELCTDEAFEAGPALEVTVSEAL